MHMSFIAVKLVVSASLSVVTQWLACLVHLDAILSFTVSWQSQKDHADSAATLMTLKGSQMGS